MRDIYLILIIFKAKIELNTEVNEVSMFLSLGFHAQKTFKLFDLPMAYLMSNSLETRRAH